MKTASTLPTFTSAYGHTYMAPGARKEKDSQSQSQQSKESTPVPDSLPDSQSSKGLGMSGTSSYQDTRNLAESFRLLTRYGDEFMDESPLVGEPGSFILSRTGETAGKAAPKYPAAAAASTSLPAQMPTPQVRVETPGKSDKSSPSVSGEKGKKKKRVVT